MAMLCANNFFQRIFDEKGEKEEALRGIRTRSEQMFDYPSLVRCQGKFNIVDRLVMW